MMNSSILPSIPWGLHLMLVVSWWQRKESIGFFHQSNPQKFHFTVSGGYASIFFDTGVWEQASTQSDSKARLYDGGPDDDDGLLLLANLLFTRLTEFRGHPGAVKMCMSVTHTRRTIPTCTHTHRQSGTVGICWVSSICWCWNREKHQRAWIRVVPFI